MIIKDELNQKNINILKKSLGNIFILINKSTNNNAVNQQIVIAKALRDDKEQYFGYLYSNFD